MQSVLFAFVCVAALLIFMPTTNGKHLHPGKTKGMVSIIQDETRSIAKFIKNLQINSEYDKTELHVLTNEFTYKFQEAVHTANQALPHVKDSDYKRKFTEFLVELLDLVHEMQMAVYDDNTDLLQKKTVRALERYGKAVEPLANIFEQHQTDNELFIGNQIRKATGLAIFSINKLHAHTSFFNKSNQELVKEIETGIQNFATAFKNITSDDEATKSELVYLVRHLEQLSHEVPLKLEYWMELNSKDQVGFETVRETATHLIALGSQLHDLGISNHSAPELSSHLVEIYKAGASRITKFGEVATSHGDQEYVRSTMLDAIAVSGSFVAEIETFLSKKNVTTFS